MAAGTGGGPIIEAFGGSCVGMCLVNILTTWPLTHGPLSKISDAMPSTASRNDRNCACRADALGTLHAFEFVHRGIADLAFDRLVVVQHGEPEREALVVVSNNSVPGQRHRTVSLERLEKTWQGAAREILEPT